MTADKNIMYWHSNKEWFTLNEKTKKIELTSKATPKAIESFNKWKNCSK